MCRIAINGHEELDWSMWCKAMMQSLTLYFRLQYYGVISVSESSLVQSPIAATDKGILLIT